VQIRHRAWLILALLPGLAGAAVPWVAAAPIQQRLAAGEVIVEEVASSEPARARGQIRAAVRIAASPEAVWAVMTDCAQATTFVPGLKRCRRVAGAADGSWEEIEHEVRYEWFLPAVRYVFRATYDRPHRIDFHRVSGDLKQEEGAWLLLATADGSATVVQYDVYLDLGFFIPQALVTRSLRRDLPAALAGLRERAQQGAGGLHAPAKQNQ
jgi:uncharacterized protein YndB with AHSA1/START domain